MTLKYKTVLITTLNSKEDNMIKRFTFIIALALTATLYAEVKLPSIFNSGMVLQQGQTVPVWGWADPGEAVTVNFASQAVSTTAGKDGGWKLALKPLKASAKAAVFTVKGSNTITF